MKKLFLVLISCLLVVALAYASTTTVVYDIINAFVDETPGSDNITDGSWYLQQLNSKEEDIYKRIATAINNYDKEIIILTETNISVQNINKAFEAFLLDNPEIFYIDNEISIKETKIFNTYKYTVKLNYTIANKKEIEICKRIVDDAINEIINKLIAEDMSEFEKELVIHDYIASQTKYYKYVNIEDIPHEKHNIYSTLIEKEAVCDGFSKAFQAILKRLGIEAITLTGKTTISNHAWNKVKLDGEWYNVDVTSDVLDYENTKLATHVYFNVDDDTISSTHTINNTFKTPECNSNKYNYYTYLDYEIYSYEHLNSELNKIIKLNKAKVLEFKIMDDAYNKQDIINEMFKLNFNNYKDNNIRNIEYFHQDNIYMFVKDKV